VAALSQALQRLAHQVEALAQAHRDPERLHQDTAAIAAELRSIVSGGGRATASPTTMPLSATERVVESPCRPPWAIATRSPPMPVSGAPALTAGGGVSEGLEHFA
jgi:hypothetical protein